MRTYSLSLAALLLCAACPHEHGSAEDILLGGASDEVLFALRDAEAAGLVTEDDARAARLVAPADGTALPAAAPATISWAIAQSGPRPRHGLDDGRFVWLRFAGTGLDSPLDVLAPDAVTSYTPDDAAWTRLVGADGAITVTLTTGTFDDGILGADGAFRPTDAPDFTIAP